MLQCINIIAMFTILVILCPLVYLKAVGQYDIRIHSPDIKMINEWMLKTLWSLLECD